MTLPVSGAISFNAINVELGVAGTTTANINQASYRTLAGVPSGQISLSNFYGKSNRVALSVTYSSSTADASLNLSGISGYISGGSDITVTINGGVYLYATSTGNPGLNITGGTTGDTLTIVNNGYIIGMGGVGGSAGNAGNGGPALSIPITATINNTNGSAYIAGGGGGGGGSRATLYSTLYYNGGGGGAGGGVGGAGQQSTGSPVHAGGAGGSIGASGSNGAGTNTNTNGASGGGGGRVLPSSSTTKSASTSSWTQAGNGGSGGGTGGSFISGNAGTTTTTGGGATQNGSASSTGDAAGAGPSVAGGGGGWGASGGTAAGAATNLAYAVGGPGKAVELNGKSVTWTSGNTTRVYGAVS